MIATGASDRRLFYISTLLCTFVAAAAADVLSDPRSNAPDHVVSMIEHGREDHALTVVHHGEWTRVDRVGGQQPMTEYIGHGGGTEVRVYPDGTDFFQAVFTMPGTDHGPLWDTIIYKTDERRTVLGEPCTVWNVKRDGRPPPGRKGLEQLSCITDDGIELWYAWIGSLGNSLSSAQATHIERRPVDPNDVYPPRGLLALDWWNQVGSAPATTPPTPDYETVMRPDGQAVDGTELVRTTRHRHPWTYVEESKGGVRLNLTISHASTWTGIVFDDNGEQKQLAITKSRRPSSLGDPKDLNEYEIVLGESCRWFDLAPGAMDAGLYECRTNDHIPLKRHTTTFGSGRTLTADRFLRRPVGPDEVRPPVAILDASFWGLE
jgi:hypothetical protein